MNRSVRAIVSIAAFRDCCFLASILCVFCSGPIPQAAAQQVNQANPAAAPIPCAAAKATPLAPLPPLFQGIISWNGQHLALVSQSGDNFKAWLDGRGVGTEFESIEDLIFSPDSNRLAYRGKKGSAFSVVVDGQIGPSVERVEGLMLARCVAFSPDSKHYAYAVNSGSKGYVIVDAQPGPQFEEIAFFLKFSPDSNRLAYVASRDAQHLSVVVDGQAGMEFDFIEDLVFSADSRHLAYLARTGQHSVVVLDGNAQGEMDSASEVTFSPDSKRFAFRAEKGERRFVRVDGTSRPSFDGVVDGPSFSPDSRHVAYAAHKGKKYWVLLDGKKGPEFEGEKSLCLAFSPDSSHLAYVAQRGGKESVVLDGQNGPEFDSIGLRAGSAFEPSLVFSADSRRLAYIAKRGESLAVVVDGQAGPEFDEILEATPLFSNDSTHMAYAGRKGHKAVVVLDGQAGPKFDSIQLHSVCFSDDSKHFAYATDRAGKSLIMLDGMAGPEFDRVFLSGPLSFDAGGAVQYLAAKAGTLYRVRQELRPEAPGQATSKPTSSAANSPSEPASLPPGKKPRIYEEWPFDAKQAAARQQETADQLGVPRDLNVDCGRGVKMRLVLIPAGRFMIGSPDDEKGREMNEGPLHEVTLTRPFYMAVTEVTQAQYFAVTGLDPSGIKDPNNPVEMLEWRDADMFCQLLSPKTGRNVHLPTEAQWEYACRAGSSAAFSFGDNWEDYDSYLWCMFNSKVPNNSMGEPHLALAGQKKPNASGLFDMHGNVAEWCADWYSDSYAQARVTDPTGPAAGEDHVRRGGSYFVDPGSCRSATRGQGGMLNDSGFRIVVDLP